ncbi:MAG: hypothetical protein NUV77_02625 [Thermoguttaceae bacterium]|jgi:hypothetical protein|nr:hypothetical protein [Thermoguttaceae bacterium]
MTELRLIAARVTVFLVVAAPPDDERPEPDAEARPEDDVIILPGVTAEMIAFFRNHPFDN